MNMIQKHATVLALTFVLVGLMFFSVDTPFVNQSEVEPEVLEAPMKIEQITEEPVPQEPLRMNVAPNPSFEDWDTNNRRPEEWSVDATAHVYTNSTYTGMIKHGSYAGFQVVMGSNTSWGYGFLRNVPETSTYYPYLRYGVSVSLDWYVVMNPDLSLYGLTAVQVQFRNSTDVRTLYYYLSHRPAPYSNDTWTGYILMNHSISSWHTFDRNMTEDFLAVWGPTAYSDTHYVYDFQLRVSSPPQATNNIIAVFDDVSMYNDTYSDWILNGDFESGFGSPWNTYATNLGYCDQASDSTDGSYSLNMSLAATNPAQGYVRVNKYYSPYNSFFVFGPETNTISWDWKYSDTAGAGISQYSSLRFQFYNGTYYNVELWMGRGDDYMTSNSSTTVRVPAPGFGTRDSWVHSEVDLYDLMQAAGFFDLRLHSIRFEVYQSVSVPDATINVLVDNFNMKTHPMGNPAFDYLDPYGIYSPFQGWWRYSGSGEVTASTDSHSGSYSANITVENDQDGLYRHDINFHFDSKLAIDFWWRLDDIQSTGLAIAYIYFEFVVGGGNRHIRYVLGKSQIHSTMNDTTVKYIYADGFNQTGVWNRLYRNITADIENAFSTSAEGWETYQITAYAASAAGMRTSLLIDDFNMIDMEPPSISGVVYDSNPMYYEDVNVRTTATDTRPGVSSVVVNYTTDGWSSWDTVSGVYDPSDWFDAEIPAQPYNTQVEFYVIVTDGCDNSVIDDNGGLLYTYTSDDDLAPTLVISNPGNNTDQSGLLSIEATALDPGSGIEYVSFNPDGGGAINDYTAPYSQNWNLDDESLGSHYIIVTARDNEGHTATMTHYITVIDDVDPVIESPDDIEFTEGEVGQSVIWNGTDIRPDHYVILEDGITVAGNDWNSSLEVFSYSLDGLEVGTYNYTCVIYDEAGNSVADTVIVTVNAEPTTTEPTTTVPTSTEPTTTEPTTTPEPTGEDPLGMILIVVGIGVVGLLLVVFVVIPKMKK
jgi:hypothetical protein